MRGGGEKISEKRICQNVLKGLYWKKQDFLEAL